LKRSTIPPQPDGRWKWRRVNHRDTENTEKKMEFEF
jgi:hypothetical protein